MSTRMIFYFIKVKKILPKCQLEVGTLGYLINVQQTLLFFLNCPTYTPYLILCSIVIGWQKLKSSTHWLKLLARALFSFYTFISSYIIIWWPRVFDPKRQFWESKLCKALFYTYRVITLRFTVKKFLLSDYEKVQNFTFWAHFNPLTK